MLKCAVLDDYQNIAIKMANWSSLANRIDIHYFDQHFQSEDDLLGAISDFEIVILMRERTPFRRSLITRLKNLKLIVTTGLRNASIDLKAAHEYGITVCGTTSSSDPPTELTWALLLACARNVVVENLSLKNDGPWQNSIGMDLSGNRLGIVGLGKIGSKVAHIAKAFGMHVTAWSQNLTEQRTQQLGITRAQSIDELLSSSDFVSIHLILSERTRGLIGMQELQKMKKSAYLINTSRAQIVDQVALERALRENLIAGAGVDVFEEEPLAIGHSMRNLPNLLATPHLGYVTERNYRTYFSEAVEDIEAFLNGAPIRNLNV